MQRMRWKRTKGHSMLAFVMVVSQQAREEALFQRGNEERFLGLFPTLIGHGDSLSKHLMSRITL